MEQPLSNEPEKIPEAQQGPKAADELRSRPAIRTLQSDVASSVRDNNISITKIALAQQEKNASLPFVAEEKAHFWSAWSVGTIILVIGGCAILVAAAVVFMSKSILLPFTNNEPPTPTLVPVIERTTADVTRMPRAELIKTIETFTDDDYSSPVALEALILQEMTTATSSEGETTMTLTPLSIQRLFERIGSRAPGRLMRSIGPDMTLGRVGATPFIVATAISYETAFAGMLEWEPLMAEDLPFITKQPTTDNRQPTTQTNADTEVSPIVTTSTSSTETASTTVVSTTTSATSTIPAIVLPPPPEPIWKDLIVNNKDVRALVDGDGNILLLYAFPKDGLIVITQTKEAFKLIVDAINAPVFGM